MYRSFLFIIVFFYAISLSAQEMKPMSDASEFLAKLKQTSISTQSIKADFTEEKFLTYLKEPHKSTGIFYYKKQNKLRWEKIKPSSYIFLVSEDKVKIKENEKEKDVSSFNEAIGKIKELMLTLVNGEFQNSKAFTTVYFQNDESYFVKLIPKNKKLANIFESIQLIFSKDTMRLKELAFYEKSGDKNIMKFYNDVVNENLPDQLFTNF